MLLAATLSTIPRAFSAVGGVGARAGCLGAGCGCAVGSLWLCGGSCRGGRLWGLGV